MGQAIRVLQKRRKSRRRLADLMNHPEQVVVIHYSCESFYDRPDGSSPRITSIAVANLESAQARSFSIHQVAERKKYTVDEIEDRYDELERVMLDEFYEFVRSRAECTWLHWNMRNIHYGFQAIAHRHKVLGGQPVEIHESKLVDLARLLHAIYGRRYISHPRLQKLVKKNRITDIDFLSGAEEATAFESGEYVKLHFSTLRKVDTLANIAQRADEGSLKTNSTWKDSHGIYPQAVGEWLNENWLVLIIEMIFAIIGFVWTVIEIYSHFSS